MRAIVVTDIFGLCSSMDRVVSLLNEAIEQVIVLDPYQGVAQEFNNEQQAYSAFIDQCGHEKYFTLLKERVEEIKPELLIGFSAGASAVWRLSNHASDNLQQILCFYPSRIRHYLSVQPKVPTQVVFPQSEMSFDVTEISQQISLLPAVRTHVLPYQHGFMNRCSPAFDCEGEKTGFKLLQQCIKSIT
ncbi:dienelactone hydrolase family protein [Vibrio rhodolitus]|uniref:dienelactone hydrolase family protein n=1 Tax=Vibrio rhodolitus TaxID=2231649 RepID=UPI000E0C8F35|nr:dienelactone hydrolase family protein [Vibrio rhodolitus]